MTRKRGKSSHLFQKTFPATEIGEREEEEEGICENAGMSLSKGTERKQYSCCYLAGAGGRLSAITKEHRLFTLPISMSALNKSLWPTKQSY